MKTTGSDALGNFKALEERIGRLLEVLGDTRSEKQALVESLRDARKQIQELESEIRDLRRERKTVRARVEDLIREIRQLEAANLKARKEEQQVV